jgi:RES domain
MILWRVSNYANLDGASGLHLSGRWHTRGHQAIYCTLNPPTALLETLVHIEIDVEDRPKRVQACCSLRFLVYSHPKPGTYPLHSQASELKIVDVIDHPSTNASSDDS